MLFGVSSDILNVIIHAKFHVDRLRVFFAAGPPKVPFPILIGMTLTTILHYRADCDLKWRHSHSLTSSGWHQPSPDTLIHCLATKAVGRRPSMGSRLHEMQGCWSAFCHLMGGRSLRTICTLTMGGVMALGTVTSLRMGEHQTASTTCRPTVYPTPADCAEFSSWIPDDRWNDIVSAMWKMTKDWPTKFEYGMQLKLVFCYMLGTNSEWQLKAILSLCSYVLGCWSYIP